MWNSGQTRSASTPPSFRSASSACIAGSARSATVRQVPCPGDRNGSYRAVRDREERGARLCEQCESGAVLFQVSRRGIGGRIDLLPPGGAGRLPIRLEPADPGRRETSGSGHRGCRGRVGARIFRNGCRHTVCSRQSFPASGVPGAASPFTGCGMRDHLASARGTPPGLPR